MCVCWRQTLTGRSWRRLQAHLYRGRDRGHSGGEKVPVHDPCGQGNLRFSGNICRLPAFRVLNLNANWPIKGTFSAIFCRNVVIYFDEETRENLWRRLADGLIPAGSFMSVILNGSSPEASAVWSRLPRPFTGKFTEPWRHR
ncbi:CheR family methyltransferase [Komagataeibacter saccharivorans]|uniref:CheR family methyltransferase n=1 Tax=Komagataeibacter saccharivorans TaxID=265959 RepID=UPI0021556178|nr:CheR family methyltransferase [Komagataeibacter saccharivorans]